MPPPDQTSTCALRCCQMKLHQNKVVPKKFSSKLQAGCCIFWSTWTPRSSSLEAHCTVPALPTRLWRFTQDWPVAAGNAVRIAMYDNMVAKNAMTLPIFSASCNHKSIEDTWTRLWHACNRQSIILKPYFHLRNHHINIGEIHRVGDFFIINWTREGPYTSQIIKGYVNWAMAYVQSTFNISGNERIREIHQVGGFLNHQLDTRRPRRSLEDTSTELWHVCNRQSILEIYSHLRRYHAIMWGLKGFIKLEG